MNRLALPVLLGFSSFASAGELTPLRAGKVPPPPPAKEEEKAISLELSAGYDTHYIFRGELLEKDTPWVQLEASFKLTESLSLTLTPWYTHDLDDEYNEFDMLVDLGYSVGEWELSLGYAGFWYPMGAEGNGEGVDDEHEMTFSVSRDIGPLSATLLTAYNFDRDGFYYEAVLEAPYEINDTVSVVLAGTVGWDTDYFDEGTEFNHFGLALSVPIKLAENVTLTPYVAANFPFDHLDYVDDEFYGGFKVAVSF